MVSTFENPLPMPLMRKSFTLSTLPDSASITVCGLGFYEMYVNGIKTVRGKLIPYVTNPDQLLPYDTYDIKPLLREGKNTVAFVLGSGSQNAHTAHWGLSKVLFHSSPKLAFAIELTSGESNTVIEADSSVVCANSEIIFSDLRYGEHVDARLIRDGWNTPDYDDSDWTPAVSVSTPNGEAMTVTSDPITEQRRMKPVRIWEEDGGYIYDFGINSAGLTELSVNGTPGQRISILHMDECYDENGKISGKNLHTSPPTEYELPKQETVYICRGGKETYLPKFTYYGFRYAKVSGITKEQATEDLLTYVVINSNLREIGSFECSDETLNMLYVMTNRATTANFHHFPTDCPQREKHGWTADASLSAEHTLLNYTPEESYKMWLRAIARAQNFVGALPGVVPTGGYGFAWGNGPAWDSVLTVLPYSLWKFRGDLSAARECARSFIRYIQYVATRRNSRGLVAIGLGDWCAPKYKDGKKTDTPDPETVSPLIFTDSTYTFLNASMAAEMFTALGMPRDALYCSSLADEMRAAIREHLLDKDSMKFCLGDQTSQSMAIYYGLCDSPEEEAKAYARLLEAIHAADDHITTGVLGARVIFRVLTERGDADLAIKLITRPDAPSYGVMIADGHTTLTEHADHEWCSANHHFWGDIAALMIEYFAGIRIDYRNADEPITLAPFFPSSLSHASASTETPNGKIAVRWVRKDNAIDYEILSAPSKVTITLPDGYTLENGAANASLAEGKYRIVRTK